ncbi:hypothetical protein AMTRI_Chr01g107820 [Amborella trichopoda]
MYTHKIQSFDEIQCNKSLIDHTQIMHRFTHLNQLSQRVIELACHHNLKLELHCYKHL